MRCDRDGAYGIHSWHRDKECVCAGCRKAEEGSCICKLGCDGPYADCLDAAVEIAIAEGEIWKGAKVEN